MNIARLSKSGQIYMPKEFRDKFPDLCLFEIEIENDEIRYKPFRKEEIGYYKLGEKKYTYKDFLKKAHFSSKNKKEENLSSKIDEILYGT